MATAKYLKIFDETDVSQELEVYLNNDNRVFLHCGDINSEDSLPYSGFITMSKEDVTALIKELKLLQKQM